MRMLRYIVVIIILKTLRSPKAIDHAPTGTVLYSTRYLLALAECNPLWHRPLLSSHGYSMCIHDTSMDAVSQRETTLYFATTTHACFLARERSVRCIIYGAQLTDRKCYVNTAHRAHKRNPCDSSAVLDCELPKEADECKREPSILNCFCFADLPYLHASHFMF